MLCADDGGDDDEAVQLQPLVHGGQLGCEEAEPCVLF